MRSLAEWVVALAVFGSVVWLVMPVVRHLAPLPSGMVTLVESQLPGTPGGVPGDAKSVPILMLDNGFELRLGMDEHVLDVQPLMRLTAGTPAAEAGVYDERLVVPFRSGPSRFWIVLERTQPGAGRQITAIYVR